VKGGTGGRGVVPLQHPTATLHRAITEEELRAATHKERARGSGTPFSLLWGESAPQRALTSFSKRRNGEWQLPARLTHKEMS